MELVQTLLAVSFVLNLLFSIHLFFVSEGNLFLNKILALFFFSRFTENFTNILLYNNHLVDYPYLIKALLPLSFLSPALIYLYVSGFIKDKYQFSKQDLIHVIPLSIGIIDSLGLLAYSPLQLQQLVAKISIGKTLFYKDKIGLFSGEESIIIRQVIFLFYFLAIGHLLLKNKIISKAASRNIERRWLLLLVLGMLLFQGIRFAAAILTDATKEFNNTLLTAVGLTGIVTITAILLYLLYNSKILYGFIFIGRNKRELLTSPTKTAGPKILIIEEKKLRNTSEEEMQRSLKSIEDYMSENKPYLRHTCRISYIAENLNMPVHHCSFIINVMLNKNFRDWLNSYRIAYFIENFPIKSDKMTIEALATEAGFSSPATFYSAFKKEMGTSPTSFFKDFSKKQTAN